ncbi:hypothetical protein QQM79_14920 [Marinobacteraceae bacterium S3BR75-40.1]
MSPSRAIALAAVLLGSGAAYWFSPAYEFPQHAPAANAPAAKAPAAASAGNPLRVAQAQTAGVPPDEKTEPTSLWPQNHWETQASADGFTLYHTRADAEQFSQLSPGATLSIPLPNSRQPVRAHLTKQKEGYQGLPVLTGPIGEARPTLQDITIVRGRQDTHITLVTRDGTWTAVVNNQSGETTLVDERDRMKTQYLDPDDGIEAVHTPLPNPPSDT